MNPRIFATVVGLALMVPAASALPELGVPELVPAEEVRPGTGQSIVGFYALPEDRSSYRGFPVVFVDEDLLYFTVQGEVDLVQLRASDDANVRYVETDLSDHRLFYTPNDYYWGHASNWGVKKIGMTTAWDKTRGTTAVKDGHIDSGRLATHEDLSGTRLLAGYDYYSLDSTPQDSSACGWHGTHTLATAAATINNAKGFAGIAQGYMLPVKIFGGSGCYGASTTNIANALKYVGNQGSHISSNSWGGGAYSSTIASAIQYSVDRGVTFVAASGNGGCSNCVSEPWKSKETVVIIVTATDSNDNGASFNSKGPQTDVSAPGVYVGSACGPYSNSYCIKDGTSMATPHVAGVAMLIKVLNPSYGHSSIQNRLKSTALDLGPAGEDDTFGAGRIRANLAVY